MNINKDRGPFYCEVCDCEVKDSSNYLDHINGKKHNRNLGISLKHFKDCTFEEVKEMLNKKKRERDERLSAGDRGLGPGGASGGGRSEDEEDEDEDQDADLTDTDQARCVFAKYKPNYVINLAARVGGLYANMKDNESFFRINMAINQNVLSLSQEFRVKKCISCLSTCIFPDGIECPFDETKIHNGAPHHSNTGYSLAKRHVDLLNKQFNDTNSGSLFTAVIPTNIYGCHDNFNLEHSHVVPCLIHKAYLSALEARSIGSTVATLLVSGSGRPLRQFIYASDLAKLILWTLENYNDGQPIILSPDESDEISIGYVAEKICEIFSMKFNISMTVEYDTSRSDGQFRKTASNLKLRTLYPGFEFTPFEANIKQVIDWFCDNYPNVRK